MTTRRRFIAGIVAVVGASAVPFKIGPAMAGNFHPSAAGPLVTWEEISNMAAKFGETVGMRDRYLETFQGPASEPKLKEKTNAI